MKYTFTNMRQPNDEKGKIVVAFMVEKDGTITNVKAISSSNKILEKEVIRVIKKSPKWLPALNYGFPVRAQFVQSMSFNLTSPPFVKVGFSPTSITID